MSGPSAAWALPLDERPPAYQPERPAAFPPDTLQQPAAGEPQATTSEGCPPPPRGGPSWVEKTDAIKTHARLLALEVLEVCATAASVSESVSPIVMRGPLEGALKQLNLLKTELLHLRHTTGRTKRS